MSRILIVLAVATVLGAEFAHAQNSRAQIIQSGDESVVVFGPLHRPVKELLPLVAAVMGKPAQQAGDQLIARVPKAQAKAIVELLTKLDRKLPEAYLLLQVEELLRPTSGTGQTRVLYQRQMRIRVRQGSPSELNLTEQTASTTERSSPLNVQKVKITPGAISDRGFHASLDFELDMPADAGPGDTEQPNTARHKRHAKVQVFAPSSHLVTVIDADLGTERGGRRVFRVQIRAVTGEAAGPGSDWSRRIVLQRILSDSPPIALLRFDGVDYRVRAGAKLGPLSVVSIDEKAVTFKAGALTFKVSPRGE